MLMLENISHPISMKKQLNTQWILNVSNPMGIVFLDEY